MVKESEWACLGHCVTLSGRLIAHERTVAAELRARAHTQKIAVTQLSYVVRLQGTPTTAMF